MKGSDLWGKEGETGVRYAASAADTDSAAAGEKGSHYDTHEALAAALRAAAEPGDVLLFKGSHGMHMEKALELFLAPTP